VDKEEKKAKVQFDFGLGGLFKGMGNIFDLVSKMNEEGKEEYSRTGYHLAAILLCSASRISVEVSTRM